MRCWLLAGCCHPLPSPGFGSASLCPLREKPVSFAQVGLDEPRTMGLDDALEYINDDEQVEVGCLKPGSCLAM